VTSIGHDTIAWGTGYIVVLLVLGMLGRRARRTDTLSDHFLAGRSLGFVVVLFTLFATQYSGNSLSGFPGKTYREGLAYFMSVTFMVGIVAGYLLFAPRLFRLARSRGYITPTDYLADRFGNPVLNALSATIFVLALGNFLLAQLMAMGHATSGLTGGTVGYAEGVIGGAIVILIYELMGGMRAVAWTDVLQGVLLAIGLAIVIVLLMVEVGTPAAVIATIAATAPEKVANPSAEVCITWLSTFLLLHLGAPLYPQAIQRLYAARSSNELRRALAVMAFIPLVAISAVVFIGIAGLQLFPDLDRAGSESITFKVLAHLAAENPLAHLPVLLVSLAIAAAIMSTADSALLSIASIVTKDVVGGVLGFGDRTERMPRLIPFASILVLAPLVAIALASRTTLWRLLEIKFEVLIQLSPAFLLGTAHARDAPSAFQGGDILAGLLVGLGVAISLYAAGYRSLGGLHPGVVGVACNYAVVFGSRALRRAKTS